MSTMNIYTYEKLPMDEKYESVSVSEVVSLFACDLMNINFPLSFFQKLPVVRI